MPEIDKQPEQTGRVADAVDNNWVDRFAPQFTQPYLRLSRADRPAGTWLLWIPAIWGVLLASLREGFTLDAVWLIIALGIGSFVMRGAGCTWNDFADREFDAQVERTKSRPIPSGQVTPKQALVWMCVQALVGLVVLVSLNTTAILWALGSVIPVMVYPFAKRFTWWPQLFLGVAFNWGALVGYAAIAETIRPEAVFMYVGAVFWTLFYDTIYAHQDIKDDEEADIKSTARLFGDKTPKWLRGFMVGTVSCLGIAVILAAISTGGILTPIIALAAPWVMGWHLTWQLTRLDIDNPEKCGQLFRSNRDAGLLFGLFLAGALFL